MAPKMNGVVVTADDIGVLFKLRGRCIYDIPYAQCSNVVKLQEWLAHMRDKNWWTRRVEDAFTKHAWTAIDKTATT